MESLRKTFPPYVPKKGEKYMNPKQLAHFRKIEETIARIDKRQYGYCEICGVEIGLKRLEARPTAMLCIDCKTLAELRERKMEK